VLVERLKSPTEATRDRIHPLPRLKRQYQLLHLLSNRPRTALHTKFLADQDLLEKRGSRALDLNHTETAVDALLTIDRGPTQRIRSRVGGISSNGAQ
jgi:hypothetical protein